jgi:hypothetical protein
MSRTPATCAAQRIEMTHLADLCRSAGPKTPAITATGVQISAASRPESQTPAEHAAQRSEMVHLLASQSRHQDCRAA